MISFLKIDNLLSGPKLSDLYTVSQSKLKTIPFTAAHTLCSPYMAVPPPPFPQPGTAVRQRTVSFLLRPSYTHAHITQSFTDFRAKERLLGILGGTAEIQAKALRHRLRAVSLFSWSIEQNARDTQMTTGLLRARDGRGTKKECSFGTKAFLGNEERL